ncbi:MAG: hypothetical protein ACRDH6_08930 [Actinomycetota bacterium]
MTARRPKEVRGIVRQEGPGRWQGHAQDPRVTVTARTLEASVRKLREAVRSRSPRSKSVAEPVMIVEVLPKLLGVAEAAEVIGWDKRHVITYLNRGRFPEPIESLAGGRIWALDDILAFKRALKTRREAARK